MNKLKFDKNILKIQELVHHINNCTMVTKQVLAINTKADLEDIGWTEEDSIQAEEEPHCYKRVSHKPNAKQVNTGILR